MKITEIPEHLHNLADECETNLVERFREIEIIARQNTLRVMSAFQEFRVSEACFAGTTGYGYDDLGRETLDKIYARVFECEAAVVRTGFVNGTHAIVSALFGLLKPGDTLLSVMGKPYDTLQTSIGIVGEAHGSLAFYGVNYAEVECAPDGGADFDKIASETGRIKPAAVLIQRSRGYAARKALTVAEIGRLCEIIKRESPSTAILVDNCYGEFTQMSEPTKHGADLIAGSLIKNPGGGLALTGGYIAGKAELVERAANRMTVPGIGGECGATLEQNRRMFQGFFMAPHTVAQALKTMILCAAMTEKLGFESSPDPYEERSDIIQSLKLNSGANLERFCRGIQSGSAVDSFVAPVPWAMPGYDTEVIMAAGTFVQGASIELSADGPMREPYFAFLQGGLTYESGRLGILNALAEMTEYK